MTNVYEQYLEGIDLTNNTDDEQCLDVRFRFLSNQFTKATLLQIIEVMDQHADDTVRANAGVLDVYLNDEHIYNN